MPLDKEEIGQIRDAFKEALTLRDKERAKEIEDKRKEEDAKKWKPGDAERRSDPKASGGRRKAQEPDKKKPRSLFAA